MIYSLLGGILLTMGGCSTKAEHKDTNKDLNQTLIQYSIDQTLVMDRLGEVETLISIYVNSSDLYDIVSDITSIDASEPIEAVIYDLDYEMIESIYVGDTNFTKEQKDLLSQKINPSFLITMVIGREGTSFLATSSLLSITKSYTMPSDWDSMKIVKLVYDGEYSSATAFYNSGDQIISGISYFCPTDGWEEYEALYGLTSTTISLD